MTERRSIFREAALERLSTPEQLDRLIQITSPRSWITLGAVLLLMAGFALWGVLGTVTTRVEGRGILLGAEDVQTERALVEAERAGLARTVRAATERVASAGQQLAADETLLEQGLVTRAQIASGRQQLEAAERDLQQALQQEQEARQRESSATFGAEPPPRAAGAGSAALQAVVYVAAADGKRVAPGMEIRVALDSVRPEEHGYLIGRVLRVAQFPASTASMMHVLRNDQLVALLRRDGAPFEVRAELSRDPATPDGYRWTSGQGPGGRVESGTPCAARIAVREQRPVSLIVPAVRKALALE